ncbi:2-dehydro-3-deoxygalactonokinase [Billgrantia montanilacus]|nr:2-dehydro-3-deoxygalactonokinase [Halomonas montanilacus]
MATPAGEWGQPVMDAFVAVDWGTSNFRAFLVDAVTGRCLDETRSSSGLRNLSHSDFPVYCRQQLSDWLDAAGGHDRLPVYLAGMVGARSGWAEAPQPALPLSLQTLAAGLTSAPDFPNAWLVPGGKIVTPDHVDVMRGEEVQAFGALSLLGQTGGLCCLPGTHSKWASLRAGVMEHFTTLMTGELFHAVRCHTLPGEPVPEDDRFDLEGFERGLVAAEHPAGVLHALFEARSRHLHDGLAAGQVGSFFSGVLIGTELLAMGSLIESHGEVVVIGSHTLGERYRQALGSRGIPVREVGSDAASIAGIQLLHDIHARAGGSLDPGPRR